MRIFIDSNFNIVKDDQIEDIIQNGLDVLKISCDGATPGTYAKYRVGGDFFRVMANVDRLIKKKAELNSGKPRVIWKYLVFRHNQSEVEQARKMAAERSMEFEVSGMRVDCGKEILEKVESSVKRDKEWIPDIPEYNNYKDLGLGKDFCEKPWKTMTINWNGDVVPCGAIYDCAKFSFGNLLTQGFKEVWNGRKFVEARRVISGKHPGSGAMICSICKKNGFQFF